METQALAIPDVIDSTIVALTPAEMPAAQAALLDWTARQIALLKDEQKDLEEHRQIAKANGWKLTAVERRLLMAKRRIVYYEKMRAAVEAGYLLVPNMPVDVFAVRVNRATPPRALVGTNWAPPNARVQPHVLPAGEGRYVDGVPSLKHDSMTVTGQDGKTRTEHQWITDAYDEVDFPIKAVKPIVLDATARAMGLKVFDQLGVVRDNGVNRTWGRSGDPIVVGQLIDPRGQGRGTTFFVAWWLDTSTL